MSTKFALTNFFILFWLQSYSVHAWFQAIRLVDGGTPNEGRVEIKWQPKEKNKGVWGTVCHDDFNIEEGAVVCRMLGWASLKTVARAAYFGQGRFKSPIWLDNVHCTGGEYNITECELKSPNIYQAFGDHDCHHQDDVGVICSQERIPGFDATFQGKRLSDWTEEFGSRRLNLKLVPTFFEYYRVHKKFARQKVLNSISSRNVLAIMRQKLKAPIFEGFLEVKTTHEEDSYAKVCRDNWTEWDSHVACGQLGFPKNKRISGAYYQRKLSGERLRLQKLAFKKLYPQAKQADLAILQKISVFNYTIHNVKCDGTENELSWCEYDRYDKKKEPTQTCQSDEPVYLKCYVANEDGEKENLAGQYKQLITQNMGYGRQPSHQRDYKNWNLGIVKRNYTAEMELKSRNLKGFPKPKVRLRAGSAIAAGRVEVLIKGRWGPICDRNWNMESANVACREMGFGSAKDTYTGSVFGPSYTPLWWIDVRCKGHEKSLHDCRKNTLNNSYVEDPNSINVDESKCSHDHEVGVQCNVPNFDEQTQLRLVGSTSGEIREGRVEVKIKGRWGAICSENFGILETVVICRQLGLGYARGALKDVYFWKGTRNSEKLVMSDLRCNGNELSIAECEFRQAPSRLRKCPKNGRNNPTVAGVLCQEKAPNLVTDVPILYHSIHLDTVADFRLECAAEEGCLDIAPELIPGMYHSKNSRRLLRFSTRTWNKGQVEFSPNLQEGFVCSVKK